MLLKVILQFFLNRRQNLFGFGATPTCLCSESISSNKAHLGSLWRRLVSWTGHEAPLAPAPHPFPAMTLWVSHLTSPIASLSAGCHSMDIAARPGDEKE